jgi:uncharacterized protein YbjT (DUF2867 family)
MGGDDMSTNHKIILIIGATGNQGGSVVQALRQQQTTFTIRAFVRPSDNKNPKVENLRQQGVEIVEGDLDDDQSLVRAMQNVYGVFSVLNFRNGGVEKEEERGKRIANIAKQARVQHFIYSSVGGADRNSGVPHFESKWHVEQHIRAIGLPYSIVRPTSFMTNLMESSTTLRFIALSIFRGVASDRPSQMVAVEDIGKWVAHMFLHPSSYLGKAVEIAGDELTFDKMIHAYQTVYGKKPKSIRLPYKLFSRGDGGKMIVWLANHGYQANVAANRKAVPDMLTFEQFLAKKRPL